MINNDSQILVERGTTSSCFFFLTGTNSLHRRTLITEQYKNWRCPKFDQNIGCFFIPLMPSSKPHLVLSISTCTTWIYYCWHGHLFFWQGLTSGCRYIMWRQYQLVSVQGTIELQFYIHWLADCSYYLIHWVKYLQTDESVGIPDRKYSNNFTSW